MRLLRKWLLLALMPLLASCAEIYSQEPLGAVEPLKPEEWSGVWLGGVVNDAPFVLDISVDDAERAIVTVRISCAPPTDESVVTRMQLRRSTDGQWYFPVAVGYSRGQFEPQKVPPFACDKFYFRPRPDSWIWYDVAIERVKALVEEGALPGQVDEAKVTLGHLGPEHYTVLQSEERPLVRWQTPLTLVKPPPGIDLCTKSAQGK